MRRRHRSARAVVGGIGRVGDCVYTTEGPRYSVAVNDLTITVGDDFADATLARLLLLARSC